MHLLYLLFFGINSFSWLYLSVSLFLIAFCCGCGYGCCYYFILSLLPLLSCVRHYTLLWLLPLLLFLIPLAASRALFRCSLCVVNSFCGTFVSLPWLFCLRFSRVLCPHLLAPCSSALCVCGRLVPGASSLLTLHELTQCACRCCLLLLLQLVHPVHTYSVTFNVPLSLDSGSLARRLSSLALYLCRSAQSQLQVTLIHLSLSLLGYRYRSRVSVFSPSHSYSHSHSPKTAFGLISRLFGFPSPSVSLSPSLYRWHSFESLLLWLIRIRF